MIGYRVMIDYDDSVHEDFEIRGNDEFDMSKAVDYVQMMLGERYEHISGISIRRQDK